MQVNHVYCGDSLEVLKRFPDHSVDAVVTSPPYAMQRKDLYGGVLEREYPAWTVAWMSEVRRVLKSSGSVLINIREHVSQGQISDYVHRTRLALREDGWCECDELIWIKSNGPPVGHPKRPRRSWERILWFGKENQPWCDAKANGTHSNQIGMDAGTKNSLSWVNGVSVFGFKKGIARQPDFVITPVSMERVPHPAVYPVQLAEWMIKLTTPPGGIVLDPFCGSGTTLVAAKGLGFGYVGIDMSDEYVELSSQRLAVTPAKVEQAAIF